PELGITHPPAPSAPAPAPSLPQVPARPPTLHEVRAVDETPGTGKVLVFFGCRGGAGATTLAVNVANTYAKQGLKVCVVDLDLQLGDVFVAVDLEPTSSLRQASLETPTMDAKTLVRYLPRHKNGFNAIAQVSAPHEID